MMYGRSSWYEWDSDDWGCRTVQAVEQAPPVPDNDTPPLKRKINWRA